MHGFETRGFDVQRGRFAENGRFGRMFPELRTLREFEPGPDALGALGGPMDGGSAFDPTQDNPRIKAGYTFLGQFIDHDLTLDASSILEQQVDVTATHNFRTPVFELDSVYGMGPSAQPHLYSRTKRFQFLLEAGGKDLQRNRQGTALIGDPRNDENLVISQLHLLFLKFHNKVFEDDALMGNRRGSSRFEEAQRLVRWHYQWIVLNEFLPRIVGKPTRDRVLAARKFQYGGDAYMPVEFSGAAYRFGHSQVRPAYPLNTLPSGAPRVAVIFPPTPDAPLDPNNPDLRGGRELPTELIIDWACFFGPAATPSKLIDTRIASPLLRLPHTVVAPNPIGGPPAMRSLAERNLERGRDLNLPSGQQVARRLGIAELTDAELWSGVQGGSGLGPLWYYILKEAEVKAGGNCLAGVGAEIVARVFVGIMLADKASFLVQHPRWTPIIPASQPGTFTMTDLVNFTLGTNIPHEDVETLPGADTTDFSGV